MHRDVPIWLKCVCLTFTILASAKGQMKPQIHADNSLHSYVDVVPVDLAHTAQLPAAVVTVMGKLPAGSVLVTNKLAKPVTAILGIWTYVDDKGSSQNRTFACDGYHLSPVQTIIRSQGAVLLSPTGCTSDVLFPQLEGGRLLGGPFATTAEQNGPEATATTVGVTIDAVICSDGEILGRDTQQYYRRIQERFSVLTAFLSDVDVAERAGTPLAVAVDNIRRSTEGQRDPVLGGKGSWARQIQGSPNLQGTIVHLRTYTAPPVFYHTGVSDQ
jgi:hypothetical protein